MPFLSSMAEVYAVSAAGRVRAALTTTCARGRAGGWSGARGGGRGRPSSRAPVRAPARGASSGASLASSSSASAASVGGLEDDRAADRLDARRLLVLAAGVLGLALLDPVEQRSRDEDRRVGARRDADQQREREVVQRRARRRSGATTIGSSVMNVVASERGIVSHSDTFVICRNEPRFISGMFSLIRSKMMIVS